MNQFSMIEKRVAQHYSHPQLEECILAALTAEGKNIDHVTAGDLAAVDHFHESAACYRDRLEEAGFEVFRQRDRTQVARTFFQKELEKAKTCGGPPPLGTHILLKGEAPRVFPNVVKRFETGVVAPVEFICRAT